VCRSRKSKSKLKVSVFAEKQSFGAKKTGFCDAPADIL
jgi:hypothetical protein